MRACPHCAKLVGKHDPLCKFCGAAVECERWQDLSWPTEPIRPLPPASDGTTVLMKSLGSSDQYLSPMAISKDVTHEQQAPLDFAFEQSSAEDVAQGTSAGMLFDSKGPWGLDISTPPDLLSAAPEEAAPEHPAHEILTPEDLASEHQEPKHREPVHPAALHEAPAHQAPAHQAPSHLAPSTFGDWDAPVQPTTTVTRGWSNLELAVIAASALAIGSAVTIVLTRGAAQESAAQSKPSPVIRSGVEMASNGERPTADVAASDVSAPSNGTERRDPAGQKPPSAVATAVPVKTTIESANTSLRIRQDGRWTLTTVSRQPIGGSRTVAYEVQADRDVQVWMKRVRPVLSVRCLARTTEVFVITHTAPTIESDADRHSVRFAFDDEPPQAEQWERSVGRQELFAPDGAAIARRIATAKRLRFGFSPFNAKPVEAEFDVREFEAPLRAITLACTTPPPRAARAAARRTSSTTMAKRRSD